MKHTTLLSSLLAITILLLSSPVSATGMLENPADNSMQSGIGLFSGWHCDADKIEIIVDDRPAKTAAYGTPRKDTEGKCGDIDNGFGLLFMFNIYGTGQHTVRALADGVEFDSAKFTVDYLDPSYFRGLTSFAEITVPELGKEAILLWQESMQGYVVTGVQDLDYSLEDALKAAVGDWSGTWQSAWAAGGNIGMTMEIVQIGDGMTMQPTDIIIRGIPSPCAEESEQTTPIMSLDKMVSEVVMQDQSEVEMQFLVTESFTTVTGTFVFNSGDCAGLDGIFSMFKQAQ